ISTQFLQIAGRIRDSKYRGNIMHVLSTTRYSENLSYEEFKTSMQADIQAEQSMVMDLGRMEDLDNRIKAASALSLRFFQVDRELKAITSDLNAHKIDLYNYRILNEDYSSIAHLRR